MPVAKNKVLEFRKHIAALHKLDPKLPDDLKGAKLEKKLAGAEKAIAELAEVETLYRAKVDQAQAELKALNALLVRARSVVKGAYGPDSDEYESVGGTKASERRKRTKPAAS